MNFRISRYHFWLGYFGIFFLAMLSTSFNDSGKDFASWVSFLLAAILFVIFEVKVRSQSVTITKHKAKYYTGLFVKQSFDLQRSYVVVDQTWWQKMLRYGKVTLETSYMKVMIKGISEPNKLKRILQR